MTDPTCSAPSRRSGRKPGWLLLTVLLVLAIVASSALVFTNRPELLKLAVILALWAAVVAAFVSVIYRRQSDIDQAKARDLKLVYDLQLDREISARREHELTVETQLRRELVSELRAQAADEVAGLRAELAALRTNLEILFGADLSHRPALETVRAYSDWIGGAETTGRVTSSRIDAEERGFSLRDTDVRTEESPIIDVPAEPDPPHPELVPPVAGGAHRRPSDSEPPPAWAPWSADWQPAPAEGPWIPAGAPGREYVGKRRASEPAMQTAPAEDHRGRHSAPPAAVDPGRPSTPPTLVAESGDPPPHPEPTSPPQPESAESEALWHQRPDDSEASDGQSVAELLARFQAAPGGGGRRRRREE
jgi:hypothetical protein